MPYTRRQIFILVVVMLKVVSTLVAGALLSLNAKANVSYQELMLYDQKGSMLSQVSGLARYKNWVVVLVQDKNSLFIVDSNKLKNLLVNGSQDLVKLKPVALSVKGLKTASWEAIEFATINNKDYVFLFHEHDTDGDAHQIFKAQVTPSINDFTIAELKRLGPALPILKHQSLSLAKRENYGYEAIVWQHQAQQLLLLPELKTQQKYALSFSGELAKTGVSTHPLRASDLTGVSEQCKIATSFCYQSNSFTDALCSGNNGSPKLSLATFQVSNNRLNFIDSKDLTDILMPVGYAPFYSNSTKQARTFNAEGIIKFNNGFLLVNDNKPQGKSRSVIRYVQGLNVDPVSCRISL